MAEARAANFKKWEWDDPSPVGPYKSKLDWWARATITLVQQQLYDGTFPHEDYHELCELLNLVLGGEVKKY